MSTIFTKIINGEIPGEFVWEDEFCVAFADISPKTWGHVLVVPRTEIACFSHLSDAIAAHLFIVAKNIAHAQEQAFNATRSLLLIEGYLVPHVHLHVFPTNEPNDLHGHIDSPTPAQISASMDKLRKQLIINGFHAQVPARYQ